MADSRNLENGSQHDMNGFANRQKHGKNTSSMTRRRCRMACVLCRNRKVRCDVEQQDNAPCTNCRLDQEACIVQNRVRQSKIAYQRNYDLSTPDGVAAWSALQKSRPKTDRQTNSISQRNENTNGVPSDVENPQTGQDDLETMVRSENGTSIEDQIPFREHHDDRNHLSTETSIIDPFHQSVSMCGVFNASSKAEIGYHYYPFLFVDKVAQLPLDDLHYLEAASCFRIPVRQLLDEIMQAYFLYVHPHLPIFNEAEFWRMYSGDTSEGSKVSLFVFHAMISTACGFVPESIVRQLGFKSIHDARDNFYRRAKALFHMDVNRDIISSSQGCLILTYYVPAKNATLNTYWLSNAICFARLAIGPSHLSLYAKSKDGTLLRRLWWCCLARDRIMSVALRRPVNIAIDEFPCPGLEDDDMTWDLENSKVYDWTTKRALLTSFTALCELVVILADVTVFLAMTKTDSPPSGARYQPHICSQRLDEWFMKTKELLQLNNLTADSVHLHTNVIYIYYHSSQAALWNHAIYASVVEKVPLQAQFSQGRTRLESALRGIDESLKAIQDVGLLHCMPLAISAFIALPMVWHIMSTKLSRGKTATEARSRLSFYFSAMNAFKTRSESTATVLYYIRQLVSCFRAAEHASPDARSKYRQIPRHDGTADHWTDVLTNQPQYFIRTTLTVELAFSRGQYPVEADFPANLTSRETETSAEENTQSQELIVAPIGSITENNHNQLVNPLPRSDTPAQWSLSIFESTSEDLDFRQAQLQDVLLRFERADYNNHHDTMQFERLLETDPAYFNDMIDYLEYS